MKKVLTFLLVLTLGFTLASCTNKEDAINVEDAATKLSVDVKDPAKVTSDLTLPTEGLHESTITWESDNTAVITNDGKVTRPAVGEDDVTVKLTATLTIGKETATKEFQFKVLASEPSLAITIAKLESDDVSDGDIVEITGIVTGRIQGKGFHIVDSTGGTYVYLGSNPENVAIGDEVTVLGERSTYFNMHQVKEIQNLTVNSSGNAIPAYAAKTIEALYDEDPVNTTLYNDLIEFDGFVAIMGSKDNAYLSWYDADLDLHKIEVYYKSGMLAAGATPYDSPEMITLKAMAGKLVTAKATFMDNYKGTFRVSIDTPSTFTEKTITDQEKANLAVAFESDYIQSQGEKLFNDLTLNTASDYVPGAALVWATDDDTVITAAGDAKHVIGSEPTANLTVTATVGTATATRTFAIKLADKTELSGMTVGEAIALDDDTLVVVQGVVSGYRYGMKPFIQDDQGNALFIYAEIDAKIGDLIKVKGTTDTFTQYGNEMAQLSSDTVLIEKISEGNDLVIDTTTTAATIAADIKAYHSVLFEMTLTYVETDSYGYYHFTGDGTNTLTMNPDYFPTLADHVDATTNGIKVRFVVRDVYHGNARIVPVSFPDLTSAQVMTAVDGLITVAGETTMDLSLTTYIPHFDAMITWTSTNAAVNAETGVVTRPAVGEADATGNLVASVVLGEDDAVEKTYAVTVKAEQPVVPDLMFSEYVEGGGDNKALELYNPTGAALDLTGYSVVLYFNGSTDAGKTLDLTGVTLAAGEVYVICNADLTDKTECDVESQVTYFNGDDAIAIIKNGEVIDLIGVIGVDPGTSWDVNTGSTKDHTLRRVTTIDKPNGTFTASEWEVVAKDTLDGLGSHTHTAS